MVDLWFRMPFQAWVQVKENSWWQVCVVIHCGHLTNQMTLRVLFNLTSHFGASIMNRKKQARQKSATWKTSTVLTSLLNKLPSSEYFADYWVTRVYICVYTVPGKEIHPRRVFCYNSWPGALIGVGIGGNGSYQPPGASLTRQDPGEKPKSCVLENDVV